MPKSKMWPEPLPKGTPVVVRGTEMRGVVLGPSWWLAEERQINVAVEQVFSETVHTMNVIPLDLNDPKDLEVWLDA